MELVTALIKSLPKQMRKNFVPAPDVARQAVAALEADFDPATDELEASLELVLRRIRGQVIPPDSWNWDAVPPHLRVSFRVVDSRGKVLDEGKDLTALQERLAPATRRAIAESLGATPATTAPASNGRSGGKANAGANGKDRGLTGRRVAAGRRGGSTASAASTGFAEKAGLTSLVLRNAAAPGPGHGEGAHRHRLPGPRGRGNVRGPAAVPDAAPNSEQAMRGGVIRLLALKVPPPDRYVLEHLNNTEKLTFSQNPHGSVTALIADCALAAIDKLTPAELPWDEASFNALYEKVRAELIDTVFTVTAVVERILASTRRIEKALKGTTSLALISALNDVKSQLEQLVYPGFCGTHGLQPAQPAAALPRRDREAPREAPDQRPAGRPAHGRGPGPGGRLRRRRVGAAPGPAGRRRVNPGPLDDRGAPGEPLRRRTRNRLFGLREADPRGAEQGAGAGVAGL